MKKALSIILCSIALCACEKDFDIERQMKDGMTYIKFVPSNDDDTTFFFVQATTALKDGANPAKTVGEQVRVTVNGTPIELTKDNSKSMTGGSRIYWTRHVFKASDEVVAEASVEGRKPVSATTTMPSAVPSFEWTSRAEVSPDSYRRLCIDIDYENRPEFTGYYGVAVRCEMTQVKQCFRIYRENPEVVEWDEPITTVTTYDEQPFKAMDMSVTSLGMEPLILVPGSLNRDYRWNRQHDSGDYSSEDGNNVSRVVSWVDMPGISPHDSRQQVRVNYHGSTEDFTISIPEDYWDLEWAGDVFEGVNSHMDYRYKIIFYSYDENCFNYLKAQNNKENDFVILGLAPASFTFTNVKGGIGVCGSYVVSETDWFTLDD